MINRTSPTAISPSANQASPAVTQSNKWGARGVSERFYVLDSTLPVAPNQQSLTLQEAGILSELQVHTFGNINVTGVVQKDTFGPNGVFSNVTFKVSSNTPLVSLSEKGLTLMQILEYPDRSFQAPSIDADVSNPLANASDYFNYPITNGQTYRNWNRIPLSLKLMGAPGGSVGYQVLQNKRIANILQMSFNATGAANPYTLNSAVNGGNAAYFGAGAVTASLTNEIWKTLNTVPNSPANMPLMGFTRYWQEVIQPFSGSSFTYNFEPGGDLLTAALWFVDATAGAGSTPGGMATNNLSQISYQYGVNKQMDVYSPYRNIQQAMQDYGRPLPQGAYVFDFYGPYRTLANVKSTENTANPQILAQFAQGYSVPANSQAYILLDKLYAVQNYVMP